DLGARLGHLDKHFLLVLRVTLDRVDQVGHQVGAALILVEHFGPGRLDCLILFLDGVVAATGQAEGQQQQHEIAQKFHGRLRSVEAPLQHYRSNRANRTPRRRTMEREGWRSAIRRRPVRQTRAARAPAPSSTPPASSARTRPPSPCPWRGRPARGSPGRPCPPPPPPPN